MMEKKPVNRYLLFLFFTLTGIVVLIGVTGFLFQTKKMKTAIQKKKDYSLIELWNSQEYREIAEITGQILNQRPLDETALFFNGLSNFYLAINQISVEKRLYYLDIAINSLRKLMMFEQDETFLIYTKYFLGKAYVLKGYYYDDLAIKYLKEVEKSGFDQPDLYEYIGEAYYSLNEYDASLDYLMTASKKHPSNKIFLRIADISNISGRVSLAVEYYQKVINLTNDQTQKEEGLYKLGKLYYDTKKYDKAEVVFREYLNLNDRNIEVHFMLGEIYFYRGDEQGARKQWFRCTSIDPKYKPALHRLYD